MEDTPLVYGELVSFESQIADKEMIHDLIQKGYGEMEKEVCSSPGRLLVQI